MRIEHPAWFLLLVPLLLWWWRTPAAAARLLFPAGALRVRPGWRRRLRAAVQAAPLLAAGLLVTALAGPQVARTLPAPSVPGLEILLLLDVSSSMAKSDLDPDRTRLEIAKEVIDGFIAGRSGDAIGLMTFARYPDPVCPITPDHEVLRALLAGVSSTAPGSPADRTGLGVALATAVLNLEPSRAPARVVILLTDGEETVHAIPPPEAAQLAHRYGVRVYTVAVARRTGPWAQELARLAETSGGRGFVARDPGGMAATFRAIDGLEKHDLAQPPHTAFAHLYPGFLLAAAVLLLLAGGVDELLLRRAP